MMKQQIKKNLSKMIVKAAYKYSEKEVNRVSPWLNYQPEMPEEVKKLRKHV